jgi:RimJ/RimL family protein N-acetyltransferase
LSQAWFDGGAHENPAVKRSETDAAYGTMNRLVSDLQPCGWSHYILSYAREPVHADPPDGRVQRILEDDPGIWRQWTAWPGPMCGAEVCKHFGVSDAWGYILDGKLVSVAQLEAWPEELEWEYGVDTLPAFRGRGFATAVLRAVTAHIAEQGHIAWHYTDHYNRPSRRLPEKLGYFRYGEGLFSATEARA